LKPHEWKNDLEKMTQTIQPTDNSDRGEALHPVDLYLQLAGAGSKLQACRRVQTWLAMTSVSEVAKSLLSGEGLDLPKDLSHKHARKVLEELHTWAALPVRWKRAGHAMLWGLPPASGVLVDCDGQAWDVVELTKEWEELSEDPEGHALALTALRLERNYRHLVWEFLLRSGDVAERDSLGQDPLPLLGAFERMHEELLIACLGPAHALPDPQGADPHEILGELFLMGEEICFVKDYKQWEVSIPEGLLPLLEAHTLGRARAVWHEGMWRLQWLEIGGELIKI
jgi:hypothetical protein